jgi:hypothetical protein
MLVLAYFLWRGKLWAWITGITMLALAMPWGAIWLLVQLVDGGFPWLGLAVLVPALGLLLAMTVPGSARRFFFRKPAYSVPATPYQPGAWTGRPGDVNHRPY